jgi:hypothetical protein
LIVFELEKLEEGTGRVLGIYWQVDLRL